MKATLLLLICISSPMAGWSARCPVTTPEDWQHSNIPLDVGSTHAWYGSDLLAAAIPTNGRWTGMGKANNFGNKFWWWRKGYSARHEPNPDLKISATRLDGPHTTFEITEATNAMGVDAGWDAMLVGMYFPTAGCWELRGSYNDTEELTIILSVTDIALIDDVSRPR